MVFRSADSENRHGTDSLASGLAQSHIPILDGVRALAVSLVIFYHAGLASPGGLGVLMFFVTSGFLITWLLLKENAKRGEISLANFYIRRSLRIFPAFYAYSILLLTLMLIRHKPILWPQAIASFLYCNNYYQALFGDPGTGFSHTWSLAVEEQFYLLWPAMFLIWKDRATKLITVLAAVIIAVWCYRTLLQFGLQVHQRYLYEAFETRLDHLLVGCLLAVVLWTRRLNRTIRSCCGLWQLCMTVTCLLVSVILAARYGAGYRNVIGFIVDPLLTAVLIVQLIACRDKRPLVWLESEPVRYLGRISYSLYLYQQLVLPSMQEALKSYPPALRLCVAVPVLIGVASASYYLIERPFLRLKDRVARGDSLKLQPLAMTPAMPMHPGRTA